MKLNKMIITNKTGEVILDWRKQPITATKEINQVGSH